MIKQGQATCRSLAAKVASAKATLDKAGKAKKDEYTVYTKLIDQDRNFAKERLQKLQDEIRAPLTEIEEREKQRIATHEANLAAITVDTTATWLKSDDDFEKMFVVANLPILPHGCTGLEWYPAQRAPTTARHPPPQLIFLELLSRFCVGFGDFLDGLRVESEAASFLECRLALG